MLAAPYRLTSKDDFALLKTKGKVTQSINFSLSVLKRDAGDTPRFGFVIPNKVIPKAHDRNRIRRVLSEATRYQITVVSPHFDCVFLPKPGIVRAYTADLMKEVGEAFKKAKILK